MRRRALLIVNPNSRNGASDIDAVQACLVGAGIEVVQPDLQAARGIAELIRRHRAEVELVIVGGGDGSMNAAAPALIETGLPLGVIPLGTANDLARTLSIPVDVEQACAVIAADRRHRIDLGLVNGHPFFNVAHIGLGAHVTHGLTARAKQRWGALAYLAALAGALHAMHAFRADIVCDGKRRRLRAIQLAVGNGRYFGGGSTVAAPARIDDGCFFLCSVSPLGWRELLAALLRAPALRAGRFEAQDPVYVEQGRRIEVHTTRRMAVSADGEIVAHTPVCFELVPAALEVFVPAAYFADREEVCNAAQG